jgi:hypothetical protein
MIFLALQVNEVLSTVYVVIVIGIPLVPKQPGHSFINYLFGDMGDSLHHNRISLSLEILNQLMNRAIDVAVFTIQRWEKEMKIFPEPSYGTKAAVNY